MGTLLAGKTAIITGGASGLGLAAVQKFVSEGAQVVIADIQDGVGAQIAKSLGDAAVYIHTDVLREESIQAVVAAAVEHFGKLDIMFNNAGGVGDMSPVLDIPVAKFEQLLQLDVTSVVLGHKHAARQFKAQGTGGSIITTASVAAVQGGWASVGYSTAKHAIVGTISHAAKELSPYGIRTNAVAPGVIMTPLMAKGFGVPVEKAVELTEFIVQRLGARQAMGRYGSPEDIANAALFLASDLSSYISGIVMPVDGGISSHTLSTSDEEIAAVAKEFLAQLT